MKKKRNQEKHNKLIKVGAFPSACPGRKQYNLLQMKKLLEIPGNITWELP